MHMLYAGVGEGHTAVHAGPGRVLVSAVTWIPTQDTERPVPE